MRVEPQDLRRAGRRREPLGHGGRTTTLAILVLLATAGCGGGGATPSTSDAPSRPSAQAAIVIAWARTDLGFGDAADCMGRHLVDIDLAGASRQDLKRHGLDALPLGARGRVGDALIVCGIRDADR